MLPIGVDAVGDAADAAGDPEVLRLENLDTDIPPLPAAIAATRRAAARDAANSYLPFAGHVRLRRAVATHVARLAGIKVDWSTECVISAGGLNGILNVLLAVVEPGDEVVLTDPTYIGLINRVRLAGALPRFANLRATPNGWQLDHDSLRAALTDRSRAMLLMSPSMPSGCVFHREDWRLISELCIERDLWLIDDAAMERILFDGLSLIHPASFPGMRERTVVVGSASKELRMIGWRVGWIVAPPAIADDIALVGISNVVCQVGIAQDAVAIALEAGDANVAIATAELQARRDLMMAELEGLPVIPPQGGWSLLLDSAALGRDATEASTLLLERAKVAATAMTGWGEQASRYVRFVFANEPVERLRGLGERVRRAFA
jgi:N-succinyldiaminopimelate aminotransferase